METNCHQTNSLVVQQVSEYTQWINPSQMINLINLNINLLALNILLQRLTIIALRSSFASFVKSLLLTVTCGLRAL